jgi:hypothetical protein
MSVLPKELHFGCIRSFQRIGALLDLQPKRSDSPKDLAYLGGARAKVAEASQVLFDLPQGSKSVQSVIELTLRAEMALAMVSAGYAELSLRVAESLLQETRVRLETHLRNAWPDALLSPSKPLQSVGYEATIDIAFQPDTRR